MLITSSLYCHSIKPVQPLRSLQRVGAKENRMNRNSSPYADSTGVIRGLYKPGLLQEGVSALRAIRYPLSKAARSFSASRLY